MYAFRIKVLGGLNLYNNEFGVQAPGSKTSKFKFQCQPNAYVEMKVEDQTRATRIIRWEVNPVWNEEFIFTCNTRKPLLKLRVYDQFVASEVGKVVSGQDAIIGEADVNLHGLLTKQEREMWVQLKGSRGKGELGVIVQECYRTVVQVVAGHDLATSDKFTKTSDVYMTVQVGQQEKQQTTVKHWTVNPRWTGESFVFYIPYSPVDCYLQCMLWDKDLAGPDDPMGWVHYNFNSKTMQRDPATGQIKAQTVKCKVHAQDKKGAAGEIELILGDNNMYTPDCADPGAVPAEQKAAWPPSAPQTTSFEVKCLGAFNLSAADPNVISNAVDDVTNELLYQKFRPAVGSSDPFLRVECEGAVYDSSKIANTLHPVWNETLQFVCRNKHDAVIKLSVFDHDVLSENDILGQTTLPAAMLRSGEKVQVWSSLDRGARGEVGVLLTQAFQIKVRVGECFDFPAMDLNGMSDPFLKIGIEDKFHQTRIIGNDRNPIYDEDFRWMVTRLGPDVFLKIEAYDSDFALFNKQVAPDFIGSGEICLNNLQRGVANKFTIPLKTKDGKDAGRVNVTVVDEMPLPPSVMDQLANQTQEAIDAATAKFNAESKAFFKILTPEDPDAKKDAVIEPADPKTAPRPRYSRFKATVLGLRGMKKKPATTVYVTVVIPSQGTVWKTKASSELKNPDFNEEFDFDVPTRTNGGVQFLVMDGSLVPYTDDWKEDDAKKALYTANVPFRTLNKGEGSVRGSQTNDLWLTLDDGTELVVRIEEDFRWDIAVRSIKTAVAPNLEKDSEVTMNLTLGTNQMPGHEVVIQKKETLAIVEDYFTVFTRTKNNLRLEINAGPWGTGSFGLEELKRGIGKEVVIPLNGPQGASVTVWIKEEEKMGLLDQLVDLAANAAKLAGKALADAADYVSSGKAAEDAAKKAEELKQSIASGEAQKKAADAAKDVAQGAANAASALGGAIGGMFKK
jgi:hypothetical protein